MMKMTISNRHIYYDSRDTSCEEQTDEGERVDTNQEHFEDDEDDLEEAAEELLTLSLHATANEKSNQSTLSSERGRGRPRKESLEKEIHTSKRGRGRPRKYGTLSKTQQPTKRGRGRPRKNQIEGYEYTTRM